MYRFLLSWRWLAFGALVLVVAAVCVRLGMWQFERYSERQADNDRTEAALNADPVPLDDVVGTGDPVDPADEWRPVRVSGRYDAEHQFVLTHQNRDIGAGVEIITPLVTSDGTAVLVDRGWITIDRPSEVPEPPAPPSGPVSVTGWLRADSQTEDWAITPEDDGTVRAVSSAGIEPELSYDLRPGWIALTEQTPPAGSELAAPEPPDLGQGPHFFYGLQWWFFAALAVGGYGWFVWTEAHPRRPRRETSARQPVPTGKSEN